MQAWTYILLVWCNGGLTRYCFQNIEVLPYPFWMYLCFCFSAVWDRTCVETHWTGCVCLDLNEVTANVTKGEHQIQISTSDLGGPQLHMFEAKREDNKDMYLYDIQLSFDILPRSLLQCTGTGPYVWDTFNLQWLSRSPRNRSAPHESGRVVK